MGKNSYEYTGINESVTVVYPAAGVLEEVNARALKLTENGLSLPAAGEMPIGIALLTEDRKYEKGNDVTVQIKDIGMWKAGAEIALGALLAVDAEGLCQEATAGQWIFARALTGANAKGDLIKVQIINAGKMEKASA